MGRWYDSVDNKSSNIVYSRIRLARNWDEYTFPSRMTREQCGEMLERMKDGLKDLGSLDGKEYRYGQLDEMQDLEKLALRERRILNLSAVNKKEPAGLFLSEDEGSSLVLGGDDHIRMQFLASGLKLDELWHQADVMDDYVNERFSYAFDEEIRLSHFISHQCGKPGFGRVWCFTCPPCPRSGSSRALWAT